MNKFFSIFSHRNKEKSHQINQKTQTLQKHWSETMHGKRKSFFPLPAEVEFNISIEQVQGLRKELDGIRKRLSTLEPRKPVEQENVNSRVYA